MFLFVHVNCCLSLSLRFMFGLVFDSFLIELPFVFVCMIPPAGHKPMTIPNKLLLIRDSISAGSIIMMGFGVMMSNATYNNISVVSWRSVLLVEETTVPGEKHRPVASH